MFGWTSLPVLGLGTCWLFNPCYYNLVTISTIFWPAGITMSMQVHSLNILHRRAISGHLCCSFLFELIDISHLNFSWSFSATSISWYLYHLLQHPNLWFLHNSQCIYTVTLSQNFLYHFCASFKHPLIICLTVLDDFFHLIYTRVILLSGQWYT